MANGSTRRLVTAVAVTTLALGLVTGCRDRSVAGTPPATSAPVTSSGPSSDTATSDATVEVSDLAALDAQLDQAESDLDAAVSQLEAATTESTIDGRG